MIPNADGPWGGLANANKYAQGIASVSFRQPFSTLGLVTTAGQSNYTDRFICIAHDANLHEAFVLFDANQAGAGVLKISLVHGLSGGVASPITAEVAFKAASIEPVELAVQRERLVVGRGIYLRVRAEAGTGTQFWASGTTEIQGTLFFVSTQ